MSETLKVTFLGTGTSQGIPIIGSKHPVCLSQNSKDKRLRVSVLITWKNYNYVIDCGPDFRQQMLANPIDKLDGILFTHEHADHTAGLDDIRPFYFKQGDIPIYGNKRLVSSLEKRFEYIFEKKNRYPGAPEITVNLINKNTSFKLHNVLVTPIEVMHNKLPILGYRFADFVYLTDVKTVVDKELEKIKGCKVLVVNALRLELHISHFNLEEAITFAKKVGAERTYFTHISHLLGFHDEVEQELPNNIYLAYDNLKITI